jgi:hypothetical protein
MDTHPPAGIERPPRILLGRAASGAPSRGRPKAVGGGPLHPRLISSICRFSVQ